MARRVRGTPAPDSACDPVRDLVPHHDGPVPEAMPGPRTPRDRALALTVAASFLVAASSLGMGRSPAPPRAPDCTPGRPGEVSWYDPDGCWEQRDGRRQFRTVSSTGMRTYHAAPPAQSRYYERPRSRWSFWSSSGSSSSGSSYRSSGSSGG